MKSAFIICCVCDKKNILRGKKVQVTRYPPHFWAHYGECAQRLTQAKEARMAFVYLDEKSL